MSRHTDRTLEVPVSIREQPPQRQRAVLTLLSTKAGGALVPLESDDLTLGRSKDAGLTIEDGSLSRHHARILYRGGTYFVEDLASTNGTFVDGTRISQPMPLEDGNRIQLGGSTILRFALQDEDEFQATRRVYEASVRDGLTGIHSRHHFDALLESEFSYAHRHGTLLSLLFVDVDHFKEINDEYGHAAGDQVLCSIARIFAQTVRREDVLARYGGEEFVVLVRAIGPEGVKTLAERLRGLVEFTPFEWEGGQIRVTISVGVAVLDRPTRFESSAQLVAAADRALYEAKDEGRNRVCVT